MRGQVGMRYSQKKVAFFDMDTCPVKLHNTVLCRCYDMGEGRENRFRKEKYTEKCTTHTSVPHPSVSIAKDWECTRDMYSAISIFAIPTHLLMDTIPSSLPI